MIGKLVKESEGFYLYDLNYNPIATSRPLVNFDIIKNKLCELNAENIVIGYDLDSLASEYSTSNLIFKKDEIPTIKQIEDSEYISKIAFKDGFEKAIEILGDKKFSLEDIKSFVTDIRSRRSDSNEAWNEAWKNLTNSILKNECDVNYHPDVKDEDGCIILEKL